MRGVAGAHGSGSVSSRSLPWCRLLEGQSAVGDVHRAGDERRGIGLGETAEEITDALTRLRGVGVDFLTVGQYLRPTEKHAPVREYVTPERFDEIRAEGEALGFRYVASGPLVRSSYKAGEFFAEREVRRRRAAQPPISEEATA